MINDGLLIVLRDLLDYSSASPAVMTSSGENVSNTSQTGDDRSSPIFSTARTSWENSVSQKPYNPDYKYTLEWQGDIVASLRSKDHRRIVSSYLWGTRMSEEINE